jgi:phosphoglycolate phosphatase-like HAD superfamily hydrolase
MEAVFLDFDGVIVDSVKECYIVSRDVFFAGSLEGKESSEHERLFYQYRGLVKPAHQYLFLHQAIASYISESSSGVIELFNEKEKTTSLSEIESFETDFFSRREFYQRDLEDWLKMNPLTDYGKFLQGKNLNKYYIVTTKNKKSVELLLAHYEIGIEKIYDKEYCKIPGGKGAVISQIMGKNSMDSSFFVDDVVGHLETVKDKRVKCFFASWGYGINKGYPVFNKELWEVAL